jgi:hypothetical protein
MRTNAVTRSFSEAEIWEKSKEVQIFLITAVK